MRVLPSGSHGLRLTRHSNAAAQQKDPRRFAQDELPDQWLQGAAIASFASGEGASQLCEPGWSGPLVGAPYRPRRQALGLLSLLCWLFGVLPELCWWLYRLLWFVHRRNRTLALAEPRADVDGVCFEPREQQLKGLHLIVRVVAAVVDDEPEPILAQQWLQRGQIRLVPLHDRAMGDRRVENDP